MIALKDMLGSAKLNGMAGHSAIYSDRNQSLNLAIFFFQYPSPALSHHSWQQYLLQYVVNERVFSPSFEIPCGHHPHCSLHRVK